MNYRSLILTILLVLTKDFDFEFRLDLTNGHFTVIYTVFPHIVSAETILFWIWKSKGHST